ncbi:arsenate reductase (glutaredoxin) [Sphingomonas sp.]|uniref:arsenate reductase (glutaredoxin) n=1 Tax=Sphingomonas sp. TaxID=28214 RepID=UPI0025EC9857|nr:arsenate reductase (glutaredoxin) [Sphingomonas sp.]
MKAIIYHNLACGTSRKTLAILEERPGLEVGIVEYLQTPLTRERLAGLYARAEITPREGMRIMGSPAEELGLTDPGVTDDMILDAMMAHPILINRPLVETGKGVRLCRPKEIVREIL